MSLGDEFEERSRMVLKDERRRHSVEGGREIAGWLIGLLFYCFGEEEGEETQELNC